MDMKILIAFIAVTGSFVLTHGTGNRLYTSYHCKDGSSSTCSGHNLKCDAGKKIFIVNTQYIFATTESSCPVKSTRRNRTGCCFDYRNDLCAIDYTPDDLGTVLSKCHTQQSCTLSTPAGSEHAKCKMSRRWWYPRSKMFSHYAMSYITYECLPDPPTIRIANPTQSIGVRSGVHIMIKGSLKKGVSCWFSIANDYFFLLQTNDEQKSIQLSHGNLLSNLRYRVKNYRRSPPKLMVHGPITNLMIELISMRYYKYIFVTWECSGTAVEESIAVTTRPSTTKPTIRTTTTRPMTTSTTRLTTPIAGPTTRTARPITSSTIPVIFTARPTIRSTGPTTRTARPTTPSTIPVIYTARPTTPLRLMTTTSRPRTTYARPITTLMQFFTTTEEDDETIISEIDKTDLEKMFNVTDEDLKEIQGEIVVSGLQSPESKGLNLPMLIGCAIGGFLLLLIITFIVALFCKRRSNAAVVLRAKDVGAGVTNPTYGGFQPNQYDDASSTYSGVSSKSNATRMSSTASVKSIPSQFADMNAQKSIDLNM
ncbi:uncharacterized protein LOC126810242 [Patella vulgata]|uniref:uncharacterized protein LOC126810242 n=1 Tax=Patella vulgata TaxID=6465 RepID=UPI0024A82956|nr:uncharacterized protein LOC126810242 [Patella vulgata]